MNDRDEMLEFATNYAAAWSGGDPERVASFFSEVGSLSINGGEASVGRQAIAEDARGFMTAFPDMLVSFDVLIPADPAVEFHWTLTGTNTGPGGKGKCVKISGHEIWQIGPDGLIAESKGYFNAEEYALQLEQGV